MRKVWGHRQCFVIHFGPHFSNPAFKIWKHSNGTGHNKNLNWLSNEIILAYQVLHSIHGNVIRRDSRIRCLKIFYELRDLLHKKWIHFIAIILSMKIRIPVYQVPHFKHWKVIKWDIWTIFAGISREGRFQENSQDRCRSLSLNHN